MRVKAPTAWEVRQGATAARSTSEDWAQTKPLFWSTDDVFREYPSKGRVAIFSRISMEYQSHQLSASRFCHRPRPQFMAAVRLAASSTLSPVQTSAASNSA